MMNEPQMGPIRTDMVYKVEIPDCPVHKIKLKSNYNTLNFYCPIMTCGFYRSLEDLKNQGKVTDFDVTKRHGGQ